jgi:hypothetical protein
MTNARKIYNDSDKSDAKLDEAQEALSEIFKEHILNLDAARAAGATYEQIEQSLKDSYIPKYYQKQLLQGFREDWVPDDRKQQRGSGIVKITNESLDF